MLLGGKVETRRKVWAIARFLGHVRPATTLKNYLHFVTDLSNPVIDNIESSYSKINLKNVIDLNLFPKLANVDYRSITINPSCLKATPSNLLKYLRLISFGNDCINTGEEFNLDPDLIKEMANTLENLKRITISKTVVRKSNNCDFAFLSRVNDAGWRRLFKLARDVENISLLDSIEFNLDAKDDFAFLVGNNRQILLDEESHFNFMRSALNYFKIKRSSYDVFYNPNFSHYFKISKQFKLTPKTIFDKEGKLIFKIDSDEIKGKIKNSKHRIALNYTENNIQPIRNKYEFVVLLFSFFYATVKRS
jgi:hypothetical protein